ncbi:MAG: CbiX/SirB N-terminal domain-containing protein [Candidatus Aminicenantes bacterium]|nr:CbiX/SirB N-terminal domain-containing protein [Candidatus Aminicenantes bacterium]
MRIPKKKIAIVLAMHGGLPQDFPQAKLNEYFQLSLKAEKDCASFTPEEKRRWQELEREIRNWPRNETNDPFYVGSLKIAQALEALARSKVFLGFNEFCSPSVEEALERASQSEAEIIIVLTPMLTPGGHHAAAEIPKAIEQVKVKYPEKKIIYAWPFEPEEVARFLLEKSQKKFKKQF